jgi:ATP-dependent protease ClpP protease subunit
MIAGMTKPTVSIVLGGSHSIGVPLAVAAQRSFAVPSAAMTIHPIRMSGTVIAAPQTYHYFERLQERIVEFVSGHSRISAEKFQSLMLKKEDMAADVGSVIYGEEAVSLGIIDAVGGLSDGLQYLYRRIDEQKGKERA